jgi:2-aminoadipate transaminase
MTDDSRYLSTAARAYEESAIRRIGAMGARVPDLISFAPGYPAPDTFPWEELRAITSELLEKHDGNVLQYGSTRGYRPLIEQVVETLAARGLRAGMDEIVITTGSQQGLDLSARVLVDPGDVIFVELPTYSGAIAAFRNLGATLVGVPQDEDGISIQALHDEIDAARNDGLRARFIYVTPNFQNPAGLLMSARRRLELLEVARQHDLLIVEDDPYGSLYFEDRTTADETRPIKADDTDDRVVYLGSFSKTLAPGFRVAWLVAPERIAERVELAKQATDLCSGVFDQRIVHQALARGVVRTMAPGLRALYQQKCTVMEQALREMLGERVTWTSPRGGFFLWAQFGPEIGDLQLFDRAIANRVSFVIGSAFYVNGDGHRFARLSFSAPTPEQIVEGVSRLAQAVDQLSGSAASSSDLHAR